MLDRARRHDEDAVAALYQRALPVIYRFVAARLGKPALVDDVVADVFLTMVETISTLRTNLEAGFYAWLIQIAQAKVAAALRRTAHQATRLTPLPDLGDSGPQPVPAALTSTDRWSDPAQYQEWREAVTELGDALGTLTGEQQQVVIGRFLAGQSIEDLAQALNKQPGAIRALQFRALGTLAERLGTVREARRSGGRGRRP